MVRAFGASKHAAKDGILKWAGLARPFGIQWRAPKWPKVHLGNRRDGGCRRGSLREFEVSSKKTPRVFFERTGVCARLLSAAGGTLAACAVCFPRRMSLENTYLAFLRQWRKLCEAYETTPEQRSGVVLPISALVRRG